MGRVVYEGDVVTIRDVEDAIRATRKYTKGKLTVPQRDQARQGDGFAAKAVTEYYEVYPSVDISLEMKASDAWAWVWGDVEHIDVIFTYSYTNNKARCIVHGRNGQVNRLSEGIPGFGKAIEKANKR